MVMTIFVYSVPSMRHDMPPGRGNSVPAGGVGVGPGVGGV